MAKEEVSEKTIQSAAEMKTSVKTYKQGVAQSKEEMAAYAQRKFKTSVKTYQQGIARFEEEMAAYAGKFERDVKAAINGIKEQLKVNQAAASRMEAGVKSLHSSVRAFKNDIKDQVKENQAAALDIGAGVNTIVSQAEKKKQAYRSYINGAFRSFKKSFWG